MSGKTRSHLAKVLTEHLILARCHVLHSPAREHRHVGGSVPGNMLRDLVEFVQRFRELHDHEGRTLQKFLAEMVSNIQFWPAWPVQLFGIPVERPFVEDRVLKDTDPPYTVAERQSEGERSVPVANHNRAPGSRRKACRSVEQESIRLIVRVEFRCGNVGLTPEVTQVKHHPLRLPHHKFGAPLGTRATLQCHDVPLNPRGKDAPIGMLQHFPGECLLKFTHTIFEVANFV